MSQARAGVRVDLTDPDVWQQGVPREEFQRLRSEAPVAWAEHPGGHRGFWVLSRYQDVLGVLKDPTTFSSREGVITLEDLDESQLASRRTMLEEDPPRHRALRNVTAAHFTPTAVRVYQEFVRNLAGVAIDEAVRRSPCDIVSVLSEQVPIRVLAQILGVSDSMVDGLVAFGNQMIGADDPEYNVDFSGTDRYRLLPFGHPAAVQAFEMARRLAAERRLAPRDDVLSALALGEVDGVPLTDQEIGTYFVLLVIAGNETTRHSITSGLLALANHRDQWARLQEGVDFNVAADEVLRWATAIHFHRRVATREVKVGGVSIAEGDKVVMYFASANFDETAFERPDRFDLRRSPNRHVAFGRGGPHFCLGAHLARMEIAVVLEELARRVSKIEIVSAPQRLRSNHINGFKRLEVVLHPR